MEEKKTMTEKEKKVNEFNHVVDATCNFLKAIFPHSHDLVKAIKTRSDSDKK